MHIKCHLSARAHYEDRDLAFWHQRRKATGNELLTDALVVWENRNEKAFGGLRLPRERAAQQPWRGQTCPLITGAITHRSPLQSARVPRAEQVVSPFPTASSSLEQSKTINV